MKTLLIRADAGAQTGTGHIMRCLALAQAWQAAGGKAIFAVTFGADALLPRLQSEGVEIASLAVLPGSHEDARATTRLASEKAAAWVAADGYCFGGDYQKLVKDANLPLLFVDDNAHAGEYCADLVLNQNLHAREEMYAKRAPCTKLLLGPRYVLLRREFLAWRNRRRLVSTQATKLLVTIGGADCKNVAEKVMQALEQFETSGLEVRIVVGPAQQKRQSLQARSEHSGKKKMMLTGQADMPALMAWADVAISGAGSTSWELCFMGVPSLLIVVAENQRRIAEELARRGAAVNLGPDEDLSAQEIREKLRRLLSNTTLRQELAKRARDLVDGNGAARVVRYLRDNSLKLRRAQFDDCKLLWEWANDPEVRTASFSTAQIPWVEHVAWFENRMADPNCLFFIGKDDSDVSVGQVRFDLLRNSEAVLHVSVAAGQRGRGIGQALIVQGMKEACVAAEIRCIHAYIKPENHGSIRAFEAAGFRHVGTKQIRDGRAVHYFKPSQD